MDKFTVESLTKSILDGWKDEGFTDVGYLEKFARGIAKGIYKEVIQHTLPPDITGTGYSVFDPDSLI